MTQRDRTGRAAGRGAALPADAWRTGETSSPRALAPAVALAIACGLVAGEAIRAQERVRRSLDGPLTVESVTRSLLLEPAAEDPESPVEVSLMIRVEFGFDSAQLTENAKRDLEVVAAALNDRKMKDTSIELEGHTDAVGPADYNLRLSQRRAETVVDYLIQRGVPRSRLTAVGYGEDRLRPRYAPTDARQRRVEIVRTVERQPDRGVRSKVR